MHPWKHCRDRIGAGKKPLRDSDTDSGTEPAGRMAARRSAVTLGDLETVTTPGPHTTAVENVAAGRHDARTWRAEVTYRFTDQAPSRGSV